MGERRVVLVGVRSVGVLHSAAGAVWNRNCEGNRGMAVRLIGSFVALLLLLAIALLWFSSGPVLGTLGYVCYVAASVCGGVLITKGIGRE